VGVLLSQAEYDSLAGGWRRSPLLDARKNRAQAKRLQLAVEVAFRKHRLRRLGPEKGYHCPAFWHLMVDLVDPENTLDPEQEKRDRAQLAQRIPRRAERGIEQSLGALDDILNRAAE